MLVREIAHAQSLVNNMTADVLLGTNIYFILFSSKNVHSLCLP